MDNHISSVSKSVRCIDYAIANSVLYRITKKYISKLHKAQNLLPCVVTGCLQPGLYTVLQQLHWLPIEYHIKFKIASITFHTLHHFSQPACLYSAVHAHHSTCSLGLSDTNLLSVPFVCTTFDARSFSVGAPKVCNSLPAALQMCTSPDTSCHDLKTHYSSGVPVRLTPFSLCLRFSFCWPLCVNCAWIIYVLSYLLTYLLTCKPADESVVCFTVHLWVCVCMYEGIVDLLRDVFWQNRFYVETKLKTDLATELKNLFISVVSDRHITALIRKWCCFSVK